MAAAIGPLLGGALTEGFGWPSIFLINVPIGIVAVGLTLAKVGRVARPRGQEGRLDRDDHVDRALFLLVFAIIRGNSLGWGSTTIVMLFAVSGVLLVAFLISQFVQKNAMFDVTLFRKPTFAGASIVALDGLGCDVRDVPLPHALPPDPARGTPRSRPGSASSRSR